MIKILKNPFLYLTLLGIFIIVIYVLLLFGIYWSLDKNKPLEIFINSILLLISTFLAISIPLYANSENNILMMRDEESHAYRALALFVGEELIDNKILIEEMLKTHDNTFNKMNENLSLTDKEKMMIEVHLWKASADDMRSNLLNDQYIGMINSGVLTKIPDGSIRREIKKSYTLITRIKSRCNRMSAFFQMIISPSNPVSADVISSMLKSKVPESISLLIEEMDTFIIQTNLAISEINKVIEPYGLKVEEDTINS